MQQVTCPGCGAPVQFKSTASVMAVCEFCKTTLLKDADSVRDLGKMSEVLEDYSPLQIGTSGSYQQRPFSVVGRIQLKYDAGFWNEWYVLFADGTAGWLSDASGQYAFTFDTPLNVAMPLFEKLLPGNVLTLSGQSYTTSDVRTARCTGGQGELPFKVGPGWEAKVADFRANDRFLSLDYSDGATPRVYVGQSVQLADLAPQLLRDPDQIKDSAGNYHGKVQALSCPSCGAPVNAVPGMTVHIVCPSCHAEVDTSESVASVLRAGEAAAAVKFTVALGAEAVLDGTRYTALGAMRRADQEGYEWSEYLMYAPGRKFVWLVETAEGWQRAEVLDRWPAWDGAGRVVLDSFAFAKSGEYAARVVYAVGSFNWRVSVGDVVRVIEFSGGALKLAAEINDAELTWSRSSVLPLDQVRAWFGGHVNVAEVPHPSHMHSARRILIALLLINAIPLYFATSNSLPYALLGAAAIYLPAWILDRLDEKGS
jgi:uncharacterized Zn finger protein (UPF0148 family)